ncbi:MAG: choice-of-anchor D domain-containing protein [Kofleriaceae bacterium]
MLNRVVGSLAFFLACGEVKAPITADAADGDADSGGGLSFEPATIGFHEVGIGSASQVMLFELRANADSPALTLRLAGADAQQFALVDSNCAGALLRDTSCGGRIVMTPTAAGDFVADLVVEGVADSAPLARLALSGRGVASTLEVIPSIESFGGSTLLGMSADRTFTVRNTGTAQVAAPTLAVGDAAFVVSSSCVGALAPGDSCSTNVRFTPPNLGVRSTSLVAQTTGGVMATAQLSGVGSSTLLVVPSGPGKVVGPGIDCGLDCEAYVRDASGSPIQVQAVPAPGARFLGWGSTTPSCGLAATCSVALTEGTVTASAAFADIPTLRLTVNNADPLGSAIALGYVTVSPPDDTCGGNATAMDTCTYDLVDAVVTLTARNECSSFWGWGGACAGSGTSCTVNLTADTAVSAFFDFATCQ